MSTTHSSKRPWWWYILFVLDKICDVMLYALQSIFFESDPSPAKWGAYWARNERGQWELRVPYDGENRPPKDRY